MHFAPPIRLINSPNSPTVLPDLLRMSVATFDSLMRDSDLDRADARVLMIFASGQSREWLLAHGDEPAPDSVCKQFCELTGQRRQGKPVAYLTGGREFFGRMFRVNESVLVPRPETELIAAFAIANAPVDAQVLDLGCGSGALAVTIAAERPDLQVLATDLSRPALEVAAINANQHQCTNIRFVQSDWFDSIEAFNQFALIVSNPPYICSGDEHLKHDGVRFEPEMALVSGEDGLDAIREIIASAQQYLLPQGRIIIEHGFSQGEAIHQLFATSSYRDIQAHDDLAGHWRASSGRERSFRPQ